MLRLFRNSAAVIAATAVLAGPAVSQTAAPAPAEPSAQSPAAAAPNGQAPQPPAAAPGAPAEAPPPPPPGGPARAPALLPGNAPQAALPPVLGDLGIRDAAVLDGRRGEQRVEGTLPGGAAFRGAIDPEGQLRMIRVTDETGALPDDIMRRLVPEPIRNAPVFAEFARVQGVTRGEDRIMLSGADAQGAPLRAAFGNDGTLQRFGRGEDGGPRQGRREGQGPQDSGPRDHGGHRDQRGGDMGGDRGRGMGRDMDRGPGGHGPGNDHECGDFHGKPPHDQRPGDRPDGRPGDRHDDRHGQHPDDRRGEQDDPRRGPGPADGPMGGPAGGPMGGPRGDVPPPADGLGRGGPDRAQPQGPLDDAAVRSILTDGGYTELGEITRNGPRAEVPAKNPEGENVTVTVSPRGVVVRELAR